MQNIRRMSSEDRVDAIQHDYWDTCESGSCISIYVVSTGDQVCTCMFGPYYEINQACVNRLARSRAAAECIVTEHNRIVAEASDE